MTKIAVAAVALLVFLTPGAQAQICIDFDPWCDGLELTITGNSITGTWINAEGCGGGNVSVQGVIHGGIDNPCGPEVGRVGIACDERFGCEVFGDEWYFVLNEEEGNWDLGQVEFSLPPPGACGVNDIDYHVTLGPCSFSGPRNGMSLLSTVQVGR